MDAHEKDPSRSTDDSGGGRNVGEVTVVEVWSSTVVAAGVGTGSCTGVGAMAGVGVTTWLGLEGLHDSFVTKAAGCPTI